MCAAQLVRACRLQRTESHANTFLDCPRIMFAMRRCAQVICALTVGRRRWPRASDVALLVQWHRARASRPLHEVIGGVVTALRVLYFMRVVRGHTFDKTHIGKVPRVHGIEFG